jgi:type VI secretion system protein ImpC
MADEETQAQEQAAVETQEGEASLLDEILVETKRKPADDDYSVVKRGVEILLSELLTPKRAGERIDKALVDAMIGELDSKLSGQLDEVLHHAEFQKIESAWTGLKLLVDRTNFRENVKLEILNCSKEDLQADFEDAPEIPKYGLYKKLYSEEYGQFGGEPVGAIIANYSFGPGPQDVQLLQNCAAVATMSHAPFVAATGPEFFGHEDFSGLPNMKDLKATFEAPQYIKWRSFRESEDARNVGLSLPRFLGRLPYGAETLPVKAFNYEESVRGSHEDYLWVNSAFAFATRLSDSFAKWRWCANIIGPRSGGAVEDLQLHLFDEMGETTTKIPTEIMITDRREFELAEEGFMALTYRKGSDNACYFSANSCQKPKYFGQSKEGKENETNYKLGTQLPYNFMVSRVAHYLKVLQRENLGSWQTKEKMQAELSNWIKQYVNDTDTPMPGTVGRRPFRRAKIDVEDIAGEPGWYKIGMKLMPHIKYQGANFELSLVGKLEAE